MYVMFYATLKLQGEFKGHLSIGTNIHIALENI